MRRAHVDHERLAATDPGTPLWGQRLREMGLHVLSTDDPALPSDLRDLLRAGTLPPATPESVVLRARVMGTVAATLTLVVAFPVLRALAVVPAGFAGLWVHQHICDSEPKVPVGPAVRDKALASLRRRPFVTVLAETVVENLPVAAWLAAQAEDLEVARGEAVARAALLGEAAARIATLRQAVGEAGPDPTRDALTEAQTREARLSTLIEAALVEVRARRGGLDVARERVVLRAELASWTQRSLGLAPAVDPAAKTCPTDTEAADLEVDIADLRKQVEAVWSQQKQDDVRFGALYAACRAAAPQ